MPRFRRLLAIAWITFHLGSNANAGPSVDYAYTDDGSSITITRYLGPGGSVNVPSLIDGKPVVEIGYGAFRGNAAVALVDIPDTVKVIGGRSFSSCPNLENVVMHQGLETIEMYAFAYSGKLKWVEIPDTVSSIGDRAFLSCVGLERILLPKKLTELSLGVLSDCGALTEIEVPEGVEVLKRDSFQYCYKLKKVRLPASLRRVDGAFLYCTSLKTVRFPKKLKRLSAWAFLGSAVEKVYFSGSAPKLLEGDMFQEVPNGFQSFHVDGRDGFTWPEWAGFPATPLGPEIVVLKRSGEPIASRRSGMFLGARVVGYERVRKLTIRNIGTKTLKGLSTRIIRNKQGDFTCTPVAKRSLEPGESMEIKIRFVPSTDGYRRAVLRIESNDSNENPVVIRLRGLGMK